MQGFQFLNLAFFHKMVARSWFSLSVKLLQKSAHDTPQKGRYENTQFDLNITVFWVVTRCSLLTFRKDFEFNG